MGLRTLFIGGIFLVHQAFAQSAVQLISKDSVAIFQEGADAKTVDAYSALWQNPTHKVVWDEFQQKFAADFDPKKQTELLFSQNIDSREIELFNARRKQMDFLKNHPDVAKLSDSFKRYVENTARWNYWYWVLNHAVARSNADTKNLKMASLPSVMTEALDPKKINDEEAFLTASYRDFLVVFVTYFNSREHAFDKYTDLGKAMEDKAAFAKKYLSGPVFPYYLCRLMRENCANAPKAAVVNTFAELSRLPNAGKYTALASAKCNEVMTRPDEKKPAETASKKAKEDDITLQDITGKTFYLSDFKGKVVYLDFWASWCGPCRAEFPHSKAMHDKLTDKQKKKIVFLYASIDENEDAWKKALEQLQLQGENGHVKPAQNAAILRKLAVNSIPRYVIIDKSGKIVSADATRPSAPETLTELLKLIE
ncbi:MAG: TlpA disulfide reductase family protein [Spirosomataceae bacterium]